MSVRSGLLAEIMLYRLGLAGAGALLLRLAAAALSAPLTQSPGDVIVMIVVGLAGLLLLIAAGLSQPPASLRWLILFACLAELAVRSLIWAQTARLPDLVVTDAALYSDFAAQLIRHGQNPYSWDLSGAFDLYRTTQALSTPRLNAAITSNYPYPALAFLLVMPFQALGWPGSFALLVAAQAAMLILLFAAAPRPAQPLILIPIIAGFDLTTLTHIGSQDFIWSALLAGMILSWRRPTPRAILFGLAASVKQSPWLVLPFLLIRLWRDEGGESPVRRAARFSIIGAVTFLLINGPFIAWDAAGWFRGVTEPLRSDLVILGHGFSSITQFGFVFLPKSYFLLVTLAVFCLLLFAYWRHYETLRDTLWIMPGLFTWFSYRSLVSYWIYWIFPLLATLITRLSDSLAVDGDIRHPERLSKSGVSGIADTMTAPHPSWRFTLAVAMAVTGILLVTGILSASSPAAVEVRPRYPLLTERGKVSRMTVEVANHSRLRLTPRFMIQHPYANPLPWRVEQGPASLLPGESAAYQIYTFQDDRSFYGYEGAQVIVMDAGGGYSLRGLATIAPEASFLWPDAVPNPAYQYWEDGQAAPLFWSLDADPLGSALASLVRREGRDAIRLTLQPNPDGASRAALTNQMIFPSEPFGLWVYTNPPSDAGSFASGLEIDDGERRLWVLFGSDGYADSLSGGGRIVTRAVPPRQWVYQVIDLPALYREVGWALPAPRPASFRGLDADLALVNLRLFLVASGPHGPLEAYFGPIEQDSYRVQPQTLMAETLSDPAGYYARLAEEQGSR